MALLLANGEKQGRELDDPEAFASFEDFIKQQVSRHEEALKVVEGAQEAPSAEAGERKGEEEGQGVGSKAAEAAQDARASMVKSFQALAKGSLTLSLSLREKEEQLKEAKENLHIERTRREVFDLQLSERTAQLVKAQDFNRKSEESFKKAKRHHEDAHRRLEMKYRESELRLERRHDQEVKVRTDLEQRMDSLRDTEKQLRERLAQERKAREAAEAAQRQMLQRHLAITTVKTPSSADRGEEGPGGVGSKMVETETSSTTPPLNLGYSLDNVREITMMNHNLLSSKENREHSLFERIKTLESHLKQKEQELDKAKLSLKRVEHHKSKLIQENEEMMETLGFSFPEEGLTSPKKIQKGADSSCQTPGNMGALSVLANNETTLTTAVVNSISSGFNDFYRHLEGIMIEIGMMAQDNAADLVDRKILIDKLVSSSKENCMMSIESAVSRVLLEILEDDRPLIINGEAHSTYALFQRVSDELAKSKAEVETLKANQAAVEALGGQNNPTPKLFEDITAAFEQSQKDVEILREECLSLREKLLLATTTADPRVAKLEQTIEKLRDDKKVLVNQQANANKLKRILEKKVSEFVDKEVAWEKDLNRLKEELKMKPSEEDIMLKGAGSPLGSARTDKVEEEREAVLRNMLLERVNNSLAAVAVARESESGDSPIRDEKGKDPTEENWRAISDFTSRLSEDGLSVDSQTSFTVAPPQESRPVSSSPRRKPAPPRAPATSPRSPPVVASTPPPARSSVDLDVSTHRTSFSSSTKDALFRLNKLGKPVWHTNSSPPKNNKSPRYFDPDSYTGQSEGNSIYGERGGSASLYDPSGTPKGYLPFARHADEALDYAIKNTAAGIHRRLSQARARREEMIHDQVYPSSTPKTRNARNDIVPPSPGLSHLTSSKDLYESMNETSSQSMGELANLKKEVLRYKRQMVKAEKEAMRARSDLNEVVDELMEVKSATTPQYGGGYARGASRTRGPRHQRNG
ncbi:hypothetical protein HOP50_11g61400 [Chloropicon primus]|uniref:Uncharacterized protein n=1 Tax=Chloropicon primus TaxID=1764295 RepID=A0A5B8MVV6_9CHLO|nr:hypothetical protein A3770_11p61180 [Chloropicon primus]UPR02813.1 hypothetical protein HOP50_11g61400 [Chloropicon primus]|eukprot:QDZ23600.1 hypothetical protein A3770_11p61180 [Chloropicon primus]